MHLYESHYKELQFERTGLFKAIQNKFRSREVLYPGCSVHITPSLYFPHVVFVDQSEAAAQFFANETPLLEFVNRNKQYKRSAYVRFVQQDYSKPLPLKDGMFDLLLALFAGGIAKSCSKYLKPGGLLLTNNHQGDALDASNDFRFNLKAIVKFQKGKYAILEDGLKDANIPMRKVNVKDLRQANRGIEYVENELYYVFERSL